MSRIGKIPVAVVSGVKVKLDGSFLEVAGPKGLLNRTFPKEVEIRYQDDQITVTPVDESMRARAMWGLSRKLVFNMVHGVSQGFVKRLEINGVGFKAEGHGNLLRLFLGYSHAIIYAVPPGITVQCEKPTSIAVSGHDNHLVGQVAAEIRALRKPEPYKGKGIRYENEKVRRKEGKKK